MHSAITIPRGTSVIIQSIFPFVFVIFLFITILLLFLCTNHGSCYPRRSALPGYPPRSDHPDASVGCQAGIPSDSRTSPHRPSRSVCFSSLQIPLPDDVSAVFHLLCSIGRCCTAASHPFLRFCCRKQRFRLLPAAVIHPSLRPSRYCYNRNVQTPEKGLFCYTQSDHRPGSWHFLYDPSLHTVKKCCCRYHNKDFQ